MTAPDTQSPSADRVGTGRWLVRDVMTSDVVTVAVETPYRAIIEALAGHAVSAVPVIDPDRRVLGVVSEADLLNKLQFAGLDAHRYLLEGKRRRTGRVKAEAETAGDLMTEPAVVTYADATIAAAARLMESERVKRLPVVGPGGRLVGIVSRTDLLRVYGRSNEDLRAEIVGPILHRMLGIPPGTLDIRVDGGVVRIGGTVGRRSTIPIAVRLVQSVPGVVEVLDHLTYHYDDRGER